MGELLGRLARLGSGEAAGGDEVVLDGERFWGSGCGGGEEAVEREKGREGGCGDMRCGEEELPDMEHRVAAAGRRRIYG